ncbi:ABC transporter permease [Klebsiella pneumoniae]|uniref:ABC transporter permease n=1 Tax=Klebsiella pneumoniae TaxID=573 RepID=A0A378B4Z7_KLEPN|nr:ABC transporter permease [Klebsiella pneumoniae]
MSLVDYTIAVRRRPEWRRVRLQPGLWLAWAVMIAALLMAIAPQWFTSANPLEGIPGAQRLAPQAHYWLGTDQLGRDLWTRVVYGAVHSLSAALIAVAIGLVVGTALAPSPGRWPDAWNPPSCAWSMSCWPSPPCCCSSR